MASRFIAAAVLFLFIAYGTVEAWPLIAGPALLIDSPGENAVFPDGITTIAGTAPRAAELTLNGAPLLHDQDGAFQTTLTFPRGGSILTLAASDRFGRTVTATRSLYVP